MKLALIFLVAFVTSSYQQQYQKRAMQHLWMPYGAARATYFNYPAVHYPAGRRQPIVQV